MRAKGWAWKSPDPVSDRITRCLLTVYSPFSPAVHGQLWVSSVPSLRQCPNPQWVPVCEEEEGWEEGRRVEKPHCSKARLEME